MDLFYELFLFLLHLTLPLFGIVMMYVSLQVFRNLKKTLTYSEAIKKWMFDVNEGIGGLFGVMGILILISSYFQLTNCGLDFELKSDGYYLVIYEQEVDNHSGNTIEFADYIDGPYTELEVEKMLDECESPILRFKRSLN